MQKTTSPEVDTNYSYYSNGLVNIITNYEQYEYASVNCYLHHIQFVSSGITTTVWQMTNIDNYKRITGLSSSTGVIPETGQAATYTSFEKVNTLAEGVYAATFVYNSGNQRAKMMVTQSGSTILTRWYAGNSYTKETASGLTKEYTYIGGDAYSAPVAAITQSGTTTYYYLLRDHLGNITHQVNTSNVVVAEYNFDAWGRRRNPTDWGYNLSGQPELFAGRGFTGHEDLPWFNLVNMNGRLYDPLVGRFLSVDPYIQDPGFTQEYNRYSYCLNNPLRYIDPSGYKKAPVKEDAFIMDYANYWNRRTLYGGGSGGSSGGGSGGSGSWFSAYTEASRKGYQGEAAGFMNDYYNQVYSPDYSETMNFHYFTNHNKEDQILEPGCNILGVTAYSIRHDFTININSGGRLDGMDYANYLTSFTGTIAGGAQFAVGVAKNQSLWNASHKAFKALKFIGVNVQTRAIKHGAKIALAKASRNIAIFGAGLSVIDIAMDGQINASHLLNLGMVGVSAIPVVGWIAGGTFFAADMITLGVSGQSIGQHLDSYVGGPLYDY
ncbi:MAG: RHS repeat-associated core domain-containing protein [Prolixibacteraceae bacterium]|nr:RHS repeat-associated core domain-containing protein [Prolixibacteraceae bacterium]